MDPFRLAHVVTCWTFLASLALQFAVAGSDVVGGGADVLFEGTFLHVFLAFAVIATAWLAQLGRRQVLRGLGLLAIVVVQVVLLVLGGRVEGTAVHGLHPALALLGAGYVLFFVLDPALDAPRASRAASR